MRARPSFPVGRELVPAAARPAGEVKCRVRWHVRHHRPGTEEPNFFFSSFQLDPHVCLSMLQDMCWCSDGGWAAGARSKLRGSEERGRRLDRTGPKWRPPFNWHGDGHMAAPTSAVQVKLPIFMCGRETPPRSISTWYVR